jgi:hypothetical protein
MRRHRPDPLQGLFRWVWSDPADDRPDAPEDDDPADGPPPLRGRVLARHEPNVARVLWGAPVVVRKAPERPKAPPRHEAKRNAGNRRPERRSERP